MAHSLLHAGEDSQAVPRERRMTGAARRCDRPVAVAWALAVAGARAPPHIKPPAKRTSRLRIELRAGRARRGLHPRVGRSQRHPRGQTYLHHSPGPATSRACETHLRGEPAQRRHSVILSLKFAQALRHSGLPGILHHQQCTQQKQRACHSAVPWACERKRAGRALGGVGEAVVDERRCQVVVQVLDGALRAGGGL
jgi:hypothetical protein